MEAIIIKLPKGKYLNEIEPFKSKGLDTDSIYHKEIPGCGFTTYAVEFFKHHLIEILPNVPVIQGKESEHNEKFPDRRILGVYKGVDVDDIKAYLLTDVKYKKILTTPEGFADKVVKAFSDLNEMYEKFFLLFDECERIITDVSYRGNIAAPIDELFKFKKKAMVSATVLPFSDERFKDFKYYIIEPTYDYSKPLTVIGTNSIISSLKKYLDELKSEHICIFFNSTNGINAIVKNLGIASESRTFCAQDSVVKLMEKGYKNASSHFAVEDMRRHNFFTSRYFSAVDMKVNYLPDIIMITDVLFAEHSILDPHTEVIQISGRFRNGVNSLTHITNFDPSLKSKNEEEARYYLKGCFDTYDGFVESHAKATNPGSKDTLKKAIDDSTVNAFYTNGKINTFMIDNYIYEERVKGYYQSFDNLKAAYKLREKHFKLTFLQEKHPVGDNTLLTLNTRQTKREKYIVIAGIFEEWTGGNGRYVSPPDWLLGGLTVKYPEIWEAHNLLGAEGLKRTGFDLSTIKEAVKKARKIQLHKSMQPMVYKVFKENTTYSETSIRKKVSTIYKTFKIEKNAKAADILDFFEGHRSTKKGVHVYVLKNKKNLAAK